MEIREIIAVNKRFVIGMVHCLPLMGTPNFGGDNEVILNQAVEDALTLEKAGVDAIIVENMGDGPFAATLDFEQSIGLCAATTLVKKSVKIPVGVDAAFNDYKTALCIAKTTGCDFVRIPVLVDMVMINGGNIVNPCARECMYYRKSINAENVFVLADVQVKHSKMVMSDITIENSAKTAAECGADGIIVTGTAIGVETPIDIIERVKKIVNIPVIVGSGITPENIDQQLHIADGAVVGTSLKEGGKLTNPISLALAQKLLAGLKK